MRCSRCKSNHYVKHGFVKNKQRYKCKKCSYNYTVTKKSTAKSQHTKKKALNLYLEGLGFRSIGRSLKVCHSSVYHWIKAYGQKTHKVKSKDNIEVVEMDEMHSFVGLKNTYCWIWIAVDRHNKKFINFSVGDRSHKTGQELYDKIKSKNIQKIMTDNWKAYEQIIPKEQHTRSKRETYTVESYNSLLRHYLARFKRKTKCYSKSIDRVKEAILLLFLKKNGERYIFP